ncbi:DUF349 domain-containing protein [Salegentibacter sp. HM20]
MSQQENENKKKELSDKDLNPPTNSVEESKNNQKEEKSFSEPVEDSNSVSETPKTEDKSEMEDALLDEAAHQRDASGENLQSDTQRTEPGDADTRENKPGTRGKSSEANFEDKDNMQDALLEESAVKRDTKNQDLQSDVHLEEDEDEDEDQTSGDHQQDMEKAVARDSEDESAGARHDIAKKDYHSMSKEELVEEFERLLKNEKVQAIKEHVTEIRAEFNAKFSEEMEEKKEEFLADGGNIIDFHYSTPLNKRFNSLYFDYKEKRNKYYQQLKQDLNKNLQTRLEIIEELKGLIDVEENINTTYKHFKDLQDRWRLAGPIPREKYNDVWNTYHHHVENFYDFLHLNREFRDLDFKHNLEQKLKVIDRAEELLQEADVNRAFRELQMLHKMWKEELGPVAKEYRDSIWDRFSAATREIHDKRQEYFSKIDEVYEQNSQNKQQIIEKIRAIAGEDINTHNKWQQKIKEIEALREEFFKAGKVPRSKNEETWSEFKQEVRKFNRSKNSFYKNLKKAQYDNLEKKKELIRIAEDNKDSDDFKTVTPLMKKIQADWKGIGHVPRKDSDKVWKQFKAACNHYFKRLHESRNAENNEEMQAFDKKKALLDEMKKIELSGNKKEDLPLIKEKIEAWKNIGPVPHNKRFIEGKFNKTLDQLFNQMDVDKTKAEMLKYENKVQALNDSDNDRDLQNEHFFLSKKIEETKADIRQLENNLQFFSNVDDDSPLVKDVHKNIADKKAELEVWEEKLRKIKSLY